MSTHKKHFHDKIRKFPSRHRGLIMAPGQEANGDKDEAILMSTHKKHFHDKIRKFP